MSEKATTKARIYEPTDEELQRVHQLLNRIGGRNVSWGAASVLEVLMAEQRLESDRLAARRVLVATWVLAVATIGLVIATLGLIIVAP